MTDTAAPDTADTGSYDYDKLYIGGRWEAPHSTDVLEVHSPATGMRVGSAPHGDATDVDTAVAAARAAFDSGVWTDKTPAERADVIAKVADLIDQRMGVIGSLVSAEMGASQMDIATLQQLPGTGVLRAYAEAAREYPWVEYRTGLFGQTKIQREAVGVVGAITAWNVPLFLLCNKLGPALAAGCSVVLKPAPETPLSAFVLCEIFSEAGVPDGVLSVVTGGVETGKALVGHPQVDKITFTGSTAAGRAIGAACGEQLKRCSLELGGKSAAIVLDDANIDEIAGMLAFYGLFNNGQACVAQTRILVPRARRDEIVDAVIAAAKTMTPGVPSDPEAKLGPLITSKQRDKVENYIKLGKEAGATPALDGSRPEGLESGYFLSPTIFTGVTNDMAIAQEEIFGPVLSVIDYDTVEEAIDIANDSEYGLAGAIWTADVERGLEIASKIRTGTLGINWYAIDPSSPFGGYKNSGIGRENGKEGLESYLEHKSIILPMGYTPQV
ncbi:aldehyde dehydrogenase [Williamsia maris]|uniref:aldehyde dehydrogenase (NAD(+)) n=1 Tax=Williamsia maris TaxID=72806 RepID=A0ABT1HEU8_9NOCA|nr:aldehyde dehydrogenase [Williamsia maris]MCP2176719.1 Acyl-CoA reductase [Williamsia maris]